MDYLKALFPQPNLLIGYGAWALVFTLVYLKQNDVTTAIAAASTAGLAVAHLVDSVNTATSK